MIDNDTKSNYQQQLTCKIEKTKSLFSSFALPDITIFTSPYKHYRMRAEFRIWHQDGDFYHIMFDKQTKKAVRLDHFPAASQLINQAMASIIPLLKNSPILHQKLFQIDYLSTLSGQLLISLLYHKKLNDEWTKEAKKLKLELINQGINTELIGRAAKQKICLDHDYVDEKLMVNNKEILYRQIENSFTQPNAAVNTKMLEWAHKVTKNSLGDLLELYCGNGNFSIALASNFKQVLATEIAKSSVYAAQHNIEVNGISNLKIVRLSAQEVTQAINGVRAFRRLKGIDITNYHCQTVLVDPPRCGLDHETLAMIANYQTILYISCNPVTLKENLEVLSQSHKIIHFALFDQFPYTDHIESGVVLFKK